MSELRLFAIENGQVQENHPSFYKLEREVQDLFEANLETLLGVRFVASEFSTGQGGRIDTLGIDENGFPVKTYRTFAATLGGLARTVTPSRSRTDSLPAISME